MKNLTILLLFCGSLFALHSCSSADAANNMKPKKEETLSNTANLKALGFTSSSSVLLADGILAKKTWNEKGFKFITNTEFDALLLENDFVIGPSSAYIGTIPESAAASIVIGYKKFEENIDGRRYRRGDGQMWAKQEITDYYGDFNFWISRFTDILAIQIIGPIEKFNREGLVLDGRELKPMTNPDPIAVVKVENGYVELARW